MDPDYIHFPDLPGTTHPNQSSQEKKYQVQLLLPSAPHLTECWQGGVGGSWGFGIK